MSALNNECRFCLKILKSEKKSTKINEDIKIQFENVTQMELLESEKYSKIICEICLRSLNLANAVKDQFCEDQRKLYEENEVVKESRKRNYELMSQEDEDEELKTVIKVEKDELNEVVEETETTEGTYENYSEYEDKPAAQKPTVSWNFTTKKGIQLNKEEKKFWQNISEKVGNINSTVLYIIQMNGYNSTFSFQGHFEADVDNDETINLLEQSVRCLDESSEHANNLELGGKPISAFTFSMGQRCSIIAIFKQIRKMMQMGNIEEETRAQTKLEELQLFVEDVLRKRLRRKTLNFPICKHSTDRFPYTLYIPCVKCQRLEVVTVSELTKPNGEKKWHARTLSYVKHVEECGYNS